MPDRIISRPVTLRAGATVWDPVRVWTAGKGRKSIALRPTVNMQIVTENGQPGMTLTAGGYYLFNSKEDAIDCDLNAWSFGVAGIVEVLETLEA